MKLVEDYEKAKQAIYDHVGFVEDWVVFPIEDFTGYYWNVLGNRVNYSENVEDLANDNELGGLCVDEIYKQRFYDKWVYEGEEFTMIFCDPGVDGARWFKLFDNSKEV